MHSRPLIGLVTNDLVGTYQYSFWSGMKAAAAEEDCDLVSFDGGELGSTDPTKAMRNSAFELIPHLRPDALVVLSPPLANAADPGRNEAFFASTGSIPLVTVGFQRQAQSAVLVDNGAGMTRAVEHLILAHGRNRFAFVGGPNFNPDAMERREAFLATLERHGIEFDPRLEATGGWDFGIARERVLALVDSGIPFHALVAANDDMALAAMDALRERGLRVPGDVTVVGFDDIEDGQWSTPSLSTVHQPIFEQGFESVRIALERIDGGAPGEVVRLQSRFEERGSCGCGSASLAEARTGIGQDPRALPGQLGGSEHLDALRNECVESLGSRFQQALSDLGSALALGCQLRDDTPALGAFAKLVELASRATDRPDRWQAFLTRVRRASIPYASSDPQIASRMEAILHQLRQWAHERAVQAISQRAAQHQRWSREIYQTGLRLSDASDRGALAAALEASARTLKISGLHLLLRTPGGKGWRIPFSMDNGILSDPDEAETSLGEAWSRIRGSSPFRTAKVVEPLVFGRGHIGHMVVEPTVRLGMLLDSFRGQLAGILHHRGQDDAYDSLPDPSSGPSRF